MALENTLEQTNELLKQIITILQTGVQAPAALGEPEAPKRRGRPRKDTAENMDAGPGVADSDEVQYFLVERHNTVYKVEPGDVNPQVAGSARITKEVYEQKKAEFAKKTEAVLTSQAEAPSTEPAPAPAPSTPAASPASSQTSEEVPFSKIVERMTEVMKSDNPKLGRAAALAVLKKWLPNVEAPKVTGMQALGKNAEILADIDALFQEPASDEFDLLG